MSLFHYVKQTKYCVLLVLSLIIEAIVLWQIGLEFRDFIFLILLLAVLLIVGWWHDKPDDFSLFEFVIFELLFMVGLVIRMIQPANDVRFLLGIVIVLGYFYIKTVKKELAKNSDKLDEN